MRIREALLPLVFVLVATACAGAGPNHAGSQMDHGSGASGQTAGKILEVVMKDISFSPDHLSVKRGDTVTFRFTNTGALLHEAVIGNEEAQARPRRRCSRVATRA